MEAELPKGFKEEDVNKHVEFLNYIAKNAEFPNNKDLASQIELVKFFNWQQTVLVKLMQDMVLGKPKVHPPAEKPAQPKKKTTRKKASK